jgi:hypothetical protein
MLHRLVPASVNAQSTITELLHTSVESVTLLIMVESRCVSRGRVGLLLGIIGRGMMHKVGKASLPSQLAWREGRRVR